MIHATSSHPAEPTWRDISADTMKMPEPTMIPATIITESKRPRALWKSVGAAVESGGSTIGAPESASVSCIRVQASGIRVPRIGTSRNYLAKSKKHPYTGGLGSNFLDHAIDTGAFLTHDAAMGWLCFGGRRDDDHAERDDHVSNSAQLADRKEKMP